MSDGAGSRRRLGRWRRPPAAAGVAGLVAGLAVVTWAVAVDPDAPGSPFRYLYLGPTLAAAFVAGGAGGGAVGLVCGLLQAPITLPAVERDGVTTASAEGLIFLVVPLVVGVVVGRLVDEARARGDRLRAVLDVQRSLGGDTPLAEGVARAVERVRAALGAERAALTVTADGEWLVAAAPPGAVPPLAARAPDSAAAWALHMGAAVEVADTVTDPRLASVAAPEPAPVRGLVVPLDPGTGALGVLAVEWRGDVRAATRDTAADLALHLALAIDNARLTLRQRRFAEELEAKVGQATGRLRELDQAKTEFLSVVAHELRTPLTALQGFSELLLTRTVEPARARRFLGHLHGEAERLGRIVAELLDIARIEAGRGPELTRADVPVAPLVERNVELFAAEHRRHRFAWEVAPTDATVRADPDALDRMLKNLLSNAVKYSPRGGQVAVMVAPAFDRPDMIALAVRDEGVGIPAAQQARIFERYVRVANPETAGARGLGLGLAVVRALAEAHGGAVDVESRPGEGSRFRVLLPRARP